MGVLPIGGNGNAAWVVVLNAGALEAAGPCSGRAVLACITISAQPMISAMPSSMAPRDPDSGLAASPCSMWRMRISCPARSRWVSAVEGLWAAVESRSVRT